MYGNQEIKTKFVTLISTPHFGAKWNSKTIECHRSFMKLEYFLSTIYFPLLGYRNNH